MPVNYKEYHPKWSLISRLIRIKRAQNRCEWCGLKNHIIIKREARGVVRYPSSAEWKLFHQDLHRPHSGWTYSTLLKHYGFTKIVLTVAHLDHNKKNNRFDNLAALCQKCHLGHDRKQHALNRKFGRNWKRDQLSLDMD